MPFNGDEFHIMNQESSKLLDDVMVFFEQFRLPLLFLISGTGTIFAFSKRTWFQFVKERSKRLILPLIFGILFIIPPQTYFQYIGTYSAYLDVYRSFSFETNHLWFLENLFVLSVVLIPFILFLKSPKSIQFLNWLDCLASKKYGILLWVIPLAAITVLLKTIFQSDSKDITNLSSTFYYGYFFVAGMLFTSSKNSWKYLKVYRKFNFVAFVISFVLFYGYYFLPQEYISSYLSLGFRWSLWHIVCAFIGWTFVISLLGFGQIWFDKKSDFLKKCNEAIYPFYILHQTVIIVLGYYIIQIDVGIVSKIGLLIVTSFPAILIIYRLFIYPFKIQRILFGMKNKKVR